MAFFTKSMLEEHVNETKTLETASLKNRVSDHETFDVFISHSYADKKYIHKLKQYLEKVHGLNCYVDWICEPNLLNRENVTSSTAAVLRKRMRQSKSLVFCTSSNSSNSKWMPWELGYFDAYKGFVAILPIMTEDEKFSGQEYLGLYPYIDKTDSTVWVNGLSGGYVNIKEWVTGQQPCKRT